MSTTNKFGSSVPVADGDSCATCGLRDRCRDPKKSRHYCCTLFIDPVEKGDDASSRDFYEMMRSLVTTESVLSDPYNIDDRDAPLAANYWEWCCDDRFLAADPKPFPWQIEVGLHVFNDVCVNPDCSSPEWLEAIPHDCDPMEIPDYLALRQNGRCPYCGKTRLDYIREGKEYDHNTLVAVVGQRSGKCLSGDSLVTTSRGLVRICEVVKGDEVVVTNVKRRVIATKVSGRKRTIKTISKHGYELTSTSDHPVLTPTKFERADTAKVVCIAASNVPWPENPEPLSAIHPHDERAAEKLSRASREDVVRIVRESCVEMVAGQLVGLRFPTTKVARAVQQFLLTKEIVCSRRDDALFLAFPWAVRYAELVGYKDPFVESVARGTAVARDNRVGKAACDALLGMFEQLRLDDPLWQLPDAARKAVYYRQVLRSGELTYDDARDAAEAMRGLKTQDEFFKAMLINALQSTASYNIVWDEVARREKGQRQEVYDIEVEDLHRFVANGIVVHNSTGIGLILSYHQHTLLKLKNPSAFYRIKAGTILKTTIVGLTYTGAKQNCFDPMIASIQESPWYRTYNQILDDVARRRGEEPLYAVKDTFVFYKPAALHSAPASPSRRNLRGKTSVGIVVDEMGHFSEDEKRINISGMEVWRALTRSLNTVRPAVRRLRERGVINVPPALAASISSPYEVSDPIMTLYNAARRQRTIYTMLRPTWEANPQIAFEDLAEEFALDPTSAWRDFGCRPPYSASAFVAGINPFSNVVQMKRQPAMQIKAYPVRHTPNGPPVGVSARIVKRNWVDTTVPKIMALDAGHMKNAFAIAVAHLNADKQLEYDLFVEVRPRHNMPVSFKRVYTDLIVPIVKELNVKVAVGDRWQHIRLMEDLFEDHEVQYIELRLLYAHFQAWRDDLLRGQWKMPRPELTADQILNIEGEEKSYFDDKPVAQFVRQCIRVVDVPGKTVDKPSVGNDDVFRVGVLCHAGVGFEEVREILFAADVVRRGNGIVGARALASGYASRVRGTIAAVALPSMGPGGMYPVETRTDATRAPVGLIRRG